MRRTILLFLGLVVAQPVSAQVLTQELTTYIIGSPPATLPLHSTDFIPVVQNGNLVHITGNDLSTSLNVSVGLSVPSSSIFGATGSPVLGTGVLGLTTTGTSGGVPYFSDAATLKSSGTFATGLPLIGNGPGQPPTSGSRTGSTGVYATFAGTVATGQCVSINSNGDLVAAGGPCTTGGGGGTVTAGLLNQLVVYTANGTTVGGLPLQPSTVICTDGSSVPSACKTLPAGLTIPGYAAVGTITTIGSTNVPLGGTVTTLNGLILVSPTITTISNGLSTITVPSTTGTLLSSTGSNSLTGTYNLTGVFQVGGTQINFPASGVLVGASDAASLTNKLIDASEITSGNLATTQMPLLPNGDVYLGNGSNVPVPTALSSIFGAPPALGSVTPNAGTFSNLTVSGSITASGLPVASQIYCVGLTSGNQLALSSGGCGASGSGVTWPLAGSVVIAPSPGNNPTGVSPGTATVLYSATPGAGWSATALSSFGFLTTNQTITLTGNATGSGTTSIPVTVTAVNGVAYSASPGAVNRVPVVTSITGGGSITYEAVPNGALASLGQFTLGSTTVALGATTSSVAGLTLTAAPNLGLRDTSAAFDVTLGATSSVTLTAQRSLTFDLANGARTLKLGSNLTVTSDPGVVTGALASNGVGTFSQAACASLSNAAAGCSAAAANPTGTINGPVSNGTATTWMRSDAAPALSTTGIAAGQYTNPTVTFDSFGRATAASNGTTTTIAANTVLGNFTNTNPAAATANSMPNCSDSGGNHLNYVTGSGLQCGTSSNANVALINQANAFTGANTFSSTSTFNGSGVFNGSNTFAGTNTFSGSVLQNVSTAHTAAFNIDGTVDKCGSKLTYNSASNANATVLSALPVGCNYTIKTIGTGLLTIVPGSGTVMRTSCAIVRTRVQYSIIYLDGDGSGNFGVSGDCG